MFTFVVGECYEANEFGLDPIKVVKRTEKSVYVTNAFKEKKPWRMKIHKDDYGNEYVADSYTPKSHRDCATWQAKYIMKGE